LRATDGAAWRALARLVLGVVLVQWKDSNTNSLGAGARPLIGLTAVASCSLLAG